MGYRHTGILVVTYDVDGAVGTAPDGNLAADGVDPRRCIDEEVRPTRSWRYRRARSNRSRMCPSARWSSRRRTPHSGSTQLCDDTRGIGSALRRVHHDALLRGSAVGSPRTQWRQCHLVLDRAYRRHALGSRSLVRSSHALVYKVSTFNRSTTVGRRWQPSGVDQTIAWAARLSRRVHEHKRIADEHVGVGGDRHRDGIGAVVLVSVGSRAHVAGGCARVSVSTAGKLQVPSRISARGR